jgi:hypothetical protein
MKTETKNSKLRIRIKKKPVSAPFHEKKTLKQLAESRESSQ